MKFSSYILRIILVLLGVAFLAMANAASVDIRTEDTTGLQGIEAKIDSFVEIYREANNLPGISVAIIRDGQSIYRKGFGWADIEEKKPARAETVYSIGSVSKSIGATLALKLEDEGRLRNGTAFTLNLDQSTSSYLTDIRATNGQGAVSLPAFHTHTVRQLLSHTGCVAGSSGSTIPGIANQTTHYASAIDAVQSIWDTGLVTKMSNAGLPEGQSNDGPCIQGKTWSYSTPGFVFIAAVLESATGRTFNQLLRDELSVPYGLSGMRVQYALPTLPPNDDRASPYDKDNNKISYRDNSWTVPGSGIEIHAVDLARFGWKVLDGEILNPDVRDNRLWRRVDAIDPNPGYALGWGVTTDTDSRRIAEHPGMETGGRALLRVYRDDALVIAILANRREHPVDDVHVLADRIGDAVLGKDIP
ncbi:MAG: CubicO group peptidase, beta-lactamase class C family [Candidatus Kentron sp. G]|nr:MAG: CubicO group peptidase, beta-lactamase class C family [Candidatus Kentron sp. G]VFM98494.1 MAG: CubicO group peptidase, beta-lactamase class C family [Candidatus Kentron sp. G]VFN05781.1 MAG: CubicO group peptidase, beta-lactamase class C family [Candidatus Kentron sp. G]